MTQDRRGRLRHPLDSLSVRLKVKRSLFNTEWVAVRPLAYSRNKLTLKTDEIMRVGDRIQVSLHLRLDFGDVLIDEAEAIVDSLEKDCSCFNYQTTFDQASRRMRRAEVQQGLTRMENLLDRYRDILQKMQGTATTPP